MMRMEEMLDKPLRSLIPILQDKFVNRTMYHGVVIQKSPFDLWAYQEIIHRTRPDHIVEIGTCIGGSAFALASMLQMEGIEGHVVTVDKDHSNVAAVVRSWGRIMLVTGNAVDMVGRVSEIVGDGTAMVIEDSAHTFQHTLAVMKAYARFVRKGCYMVVDDTICGHGLDGTEFSPGPYEAVQAFMAEDDRFEVDRYAESFCLTWNPGGFLRRKA